MKKWFDSHKKYIAEIPNLIYLLSISVLVVVIRGFAFGTGDQVIHIPLLYKLIDPTLFVSDYLFPVSFSNYTILYELLVLFIRVFNTDFFSAFFCLYVVGNALLVIFVYYSTFNITKNKLIALLTPLLLVVQYPVGGSAIATVESGLTPRFVAIIVLIPALWSLYVGKIRFHFLALGILFLIHPISAGLTFLVSSITFAVTRNKQSFKYFIQGVGIFAVFFFLYVPTLLKNSNFDLSYPFDQSKWLTVLQLRNPYAFPLQWSLKSYVFLFISLIPLLCSLAYKKGTLKWQMNDTISVLVLFTSGILFIVQVIFTAVIVEPSMIRLQIGRVWILPVYISFIYALAAVSGIAKRMSMTPNLVRLIVFVFLFVGALIKYPFMFSTQPTDWIQTQLWARKHTSKECTYLVDFYSQGFRVYSQRSIIGDYKDGTLSFYSKQFADMWSRKKIYFDSTRHGGYVFSLADIKRDFPHSFVVVQNSVPVDLEKIYANDTYSIYKSKPMESNCKIL